MGMSRFVLCLLLLVSGCSTPGAYGVAQVGESFFLKTTKPEGADREADRARKAVEELELQPLFEKALARAREKAEAISLPGFTEDVAAIEASEIEFAWWEDAETSDEPLEGSASYTSSADLADGDLPELPEGTRITAKLACDVDRFPAGDDAPNGFVINVRTTVGWYGTARGSFLVAEALAREALEQARKKAREATTPRE